jgi:hypothetical protein
MFVERKVHYSALFTNLVGWHAGPVSFPLSDVILAQLACPLSDVMFLFTFKNNISLQNCNIGCSKIVVPKLYPSEERKQPLNLCSNSFCKVVFTPRRKSL